MKEERHLIAMVPKGYRPIHEDSIASLRALIAKAEKGEVTAFVFAACEPGFSYWLSRTATTRQDRTNLIGQLQMLIRDLLNDEDVALHRGE